MKREDVALVERMIQAAIEKLNSIPAIIEPKAGPKLEIEKDPAPKKSEKETK
jgi:hypothetical protein